MLVDIKIKMLSEKAKVPTYSHYTDACFDLYSVEDVTFHPGERKLIHTGIAVYFEAGLEMQIRPRSGLSKKGLTIVNSPGTIDYGYTNEILIHLINLGGEVVSIREGDRVAQGTLKTVLKAVFEPVSELPNTERGLKGWGSSGD
jgi:dUTP pyrophosphatase